MAFSSCGGVVFHPSLTVPLATLGPFPILPYKNFLVRLRESTKPRLLAGFDRLVVFLQFRILPLGRFVGFGILALGVVKEGRR